MEKKKKRFQMPHTYIIIFFVILFAAVLTMFVPLGKYDTMEISYMQNGEERTREVLDPDSFQYILDENGDNDDGQVYLYRFIDNGEDEEPGLENILEDEEFERVSEAFNDWMEEQDFGDIDLDDIE